MPAALKCVFVRQCVNAFFNLELWVVRELLLGHKHVYKKSDEIRSSK